MNAGILAAARRTVRSATFRSSELGEYSVICAAHTSALYFRSCPDFSIPTIDSTDADLPDFSVQENSEKGDKVQIKGKKWKHIFLNLFY